VRPYSLDEHWELLVAEYEALGLPVPWIDTMWFRLQLKWLRWRTPRGSGRGR
jgi:hypothetical protein